MARKPRIEFEGAFYHVIARGNQRQKIFKKHEDHPAYLEILTNYKQRYKFFLYSYVLMNNHVHLLVETQDIPLSKIFQGVNQSYTQYFNKKYKTVGHLFQGRYKAILCNRDEYLLSLVKYIHLNPVRAKITAHADGYKWSGHHSYVKNVNDGLVDADPVLRMFSENKATARKLYGNYMNEGMSLEKKDVYSATDQRILGDETFVERVTGKNDPGTKEEIRRRNISLNDISDKVEKASGITLKEMQENGKTRRVSSARKLFSVVANKLGYKYKEIAVHIRKDPAVVTRYTKNCDNLRVEIDKLMDTI